MSESGSSRRLSIGILFNFNPRWMGGVVYIINLIKTFDFLDDENKPEITLFYRPDLEKYVAEISYPYLVSVEWKFPPVYTGYIKSWLLGKNVFVDGILAKYNLDALYPVHDFPVKTRTKTRLVSWYADLQHKHYPEFFSLRKILERNARFRFMLNNSRYLVVSSQSVANDVRKFFRTGKDLKLIIFHFVSVTDVFNQLDIIELRQKYNLPEKYYIISNQFHKHKNHKVILKALVRLKEKKQDIHFAMTGRFPDASHSPYMQELHSIIDEYHLAPHLSFLGIIPRNEQLFLMKHSQAVLQPSLFEGWSTVIEDAISLQVPVIASSLPVNIEQLGASGYYFEAQDDNKLAGILSNFPSRNPEDIFYENYSIRVRKAALGFIKIFQD
jgi:glycosyltransferase involved in cell wall biosynthesis